MRVEGGVEVRNRGGGGDKRRERVEREWVRVEGGVEVRNRGGGYKKGEGGERMGKGRGGSGIEVGGGG